MTVVVILGAVLTLLGLGGLGYCVRVGLSIRRGGMPAEAAKSRLNRLVAVNLGSVALATVGLAIIAAGVILG